MNLELLLSDIAEIKAEDFDYKYAYRDRETNKPLRWFGKPLDEVLPKAKVCISGYLMSKYGFDTTTGLHAKYDISIKQLNAIILPNSCIIFNDDTTMRSPSSRSSLQRVLQHVNKITKDENWLNDEIESVFEK